MNAQESKNRKISPITYSEHESQIVANPAG